MTISLELTSSEESVRAICEKRGGVFYRTYPRPIPFESYDDYWQFTGKDGFERVEAQTAHWIYCYWLPSKSLKIAGPQGITQPKYTGEAK